MPENDLYTLGSKDIEVNQGSPSVNYIKESPLYFNTLKKDQKNEELSMDSDANLDQKGHLGKDICVPKFPDLTNTRSEEENFEMNSKDFLENNRILRNEFMRNNHFFNKKLNNNFIKEIYDSINDEDGKKESYRLQPKKEKERNKEQEKNLGDEKNKEPERNFMFFESFNDHIPKIQISNVEIPYKTHFYHDYNNFKTNNNYDDHQRNQNNNSQFKEAERYYPKNTPEFQKFQTRISANSSQNEEGNSRLKSKQSESPSFYEMQRNNSKPFKKLEKNYDLPLKCNDKHSEDLLKDFDSRSKLTEDDRRFPRKSTEIFDESIDENLSKDLKTQLNEHLLCNKENISKFNKPKKNENFCDNQTTYLIDDMTSFKNTNSSILNQNSDRLKSSPIISIHIHESIKKDLKHNNEKKHQNSDFKFLEDYRLESVKNKQNKPQNDIANKNSTTIGLSSIENTTDNNSEKPVYVFNMEIISSNCLSPIVKENIINLLKSNSNYVNLYCFI